jgi:hypothetical protein
MALPSCGEERFPSGKNLQFHAELQGREAQDAELSFANLPGSLSPVRDPVLQVSMVCSLQAEVSEQWSLLP